MQRDNEKILQVSAEALEQIRQTAIALLQAGADINYVREYLGSAQYLQRSVNMLCESERESERMELRRPRFGDSPCSESEPMRNQRGDVISGDVEVPDSYLPVLLDRRSGVTISTAIT